VEARVVLDQALRELLAILAVVVTRGVETIRIAVDVTMLCLVTAPRNPVRITKSNRDVLPTLPRTILSSAVVSILVNHSILQLRWILVGLVEVQPTVSL
jgi:hypothetical protein